MARSPIHWSFFKHNIRPYLLEFLRPLGADYPADTPRTPILGAPLIIESPTLLSAPPTFIAEV